MHIHKTGGQSLSRFLERFFAPHEICPHNVDHAILTCSANELARYKFFRGHISPHALSQRVPTFTTITIVRNPRERLFSTFYYWQRMAIQKEPHLPSVMRRFPSMTFADFLSSPETHHCADNVQARLLAGGYFGTTNDERIMVYGDPYPIVRDTFAYIGRTEHLDTAAEAICRILGFTLPESTEGRVVPRVNIGNYVHRELTEEEEELLSRRTAHDWLAYDPLLGEA